MLTKDHDRDLSRGKTISISVGEALKTIWPFWLAALAVLLAVAFVMVGLGKLVSSGADLEAAADAAAEGPDRLQAGYHRVHRLIAREVVDDGLASV